MGKINLIVDPNSINLNAMQQLVSQFNALPGSQEFLTVNNATISGNVYVTDNINSSVVSQGNRNAYRNLGYRAIDQMKGSKAIIFNSNPPDSKPLLNSLVHEIGHIKWPGLGSDATQHDPLFYALLNNALQSLGVHVDPQQDLQGVNISNVKLPQGAINDPLGYTISNGRTELNNDIDYAQAATGSWVTNVSTDGRTVISSRFDSSGNLQQRDTYNYDASGNVSSTNFQDSASNSTETDNYNPQSGGGVSVSSTFQSGNMSNTVEYTASGSENTLNVSGQGANVNADQSTLYFSSGSTGRLIGDFDNVNLGNSANISYNGSSSQITASYAALNLGPNSSGDLYGSNSTIVLQSNTGDHFGVDGTGETVVGDSGSDHVNLLGDNTSATVSGGGVVGLVGNSQTLTLGDQGETIQTAGGDQYDNVIGSGANIGYAANVRGDVTGNSDNVNLQGNTGDHLGVTGVGEIITGDTGSDHVNLLGDNTSATVDGGGVVGLVGNGQSLALGNQGDTVQTAAGDQNENISGSGETIGFAANTSGNISGQNDQVGLQSNSGDNVGVSGQGMVITGDGGNNGVNLDGNGTTATVYGGGYVGLVGNNETLQVATNQDFTIDVAPGQTNDAIYADNSTINLPGGWDGSIYGQGLTINMDPNSGSQVMVYGYDDTFNGNQGDSVGADAYDPSNPNDPYAPYQDGDPSPGTPYDPEDPDPTDPGDPGDPGDGEDPDDFGEEKLATNGRTATSHEAKLTSSSSDTHTSASNPSTIKTTPMAGDVASSSYPPEVAARVSQLVSAMATFGAPSASDTSSNTTTGASHPSLTVDPSQSGHAMQTVRHAA